MKKFLPAGMYTSGILLVLAMGIASAQAGLSSPGPSSAPDPANCYSVCSGVSDPCDGSNDVCFCDQPECYGTSGDDVMCGDDSDQVFHGGAGDDVICAGRGADTLHGGNGCDDLQGQGGSDELHGGHCADSLDGGYGDNSCYGGWGNDDFGDCDLAVEGKYPDHKSQGDCVSVICGNDQ